MEFLSYILPFLFVLTIVIFFHELGHFSVARFFNVKIETFSIGFGRSIMRWTDKKGTEWKVGWLPVGGYVKFFGDEGVTSTPDRARLEEIKSRNAIGVDAATLSPMEAGPATKISPFDEEECFHFKPLYQRSLIVAAGPFANFALAITIFAFMFMFVGQASIDPVVDGVVEDSPAAAAGFEVGDRVIAIDGRSIDSFTKMQEIVTISAGLTLIFDVDRNGQTVVLPVTPAIRDVEDRFGNKHRIGQIGIQRTRTADDGAVEYKKFGPIDSIVLGVDRTWFIIDRTFRFIGGLFMGREDASQLSGPIGIAKISGEVARIGIAPLIQLTAILSVSIGLINIFPIPMLDGGHLLYNAYEAVRGRPLGEQAQEYGFRIGLALVLMLMVFATWNDLIKLQLFG
jgi:regulator of sigma E protease